jgi:hypothetical protein
VFEVSRSFRRKPYHPKLVVIVGVIIIIIIMSQQDRGQYYNPFRTKSEEEAGWNNPFLTTDVNHQYQPQYQPSLSPEEEWMNPSFGDGGGGTLWKKSLLSEPSSWDSPKLVDTSLESDSDWSPERGGASMFLSRPSPDRSAAASSLTPSAASSYYNHSSSSSIINSARMMLEERLSILFDGVSSEPSCRIVGRLHVRTRKIVFAPSYHRVLSS